MANTNLCFFYLYFFTTLKTSLSKILVLWPTFLLLYLDMFGPFQTVYLFIIINVTKIYNTIKPESKLGKEVIGVNVWGLTFLKILWLEVRRT